MLAYLSGSVELSEGNGRLWRRKLTPYLKDKLGHRVYDPAEDEKKNLNHEEIANFRRWKMTDLDRFRRVVRKIIAFDLEVVERRADYVICYWEEEAARGGGMAAELASAHRKGIPVYLIASVPVEQISDWALGCSDQLFSSIESLKTFLSARFSRERQTQLWKDERR
jgi:hypothetical protein